MKESTKKRIAYGFFLLPAIFFFTVSVYYPLIYSIILSFTNWDGYDSSMVKFVGLYNYRNIIKYPDLIRPFVNTIKFALFTTFIQNTIQLILALGLDMKMKLRGVIRAAFYIPALLSGVVISAVFTYILQYHGILNAIFNSLGMDYLVNDWFGNSNTAFFMIIAINVWQWTGFGAVIYLAGLQNIPVDYHEAATIDGASAITRFRYITFPLIMPQVTIMTFMGLTGGLKLFELPFILTQGGPAGATETIGTFLFKVNASGKVAQACSIAVVMMLFVVILSVIQISITRRREVEA